MPLPADEGTPVAHTGPDEQRSPHSIADLGFVNSCNANNNTRSGVIGLRAGGTSVRAAMRMLIWDGKPICEGAFNSVKYKGISTYIINS